MDGDRIYFDFSDILLGLSSRTSRANFSFFCPKSKNDRVEEFEQLATNASDENKQAYYQHCVSNKQQLIEQVARHKALAVEKEKERILQLQVEIKQLTRSFFVGVGDRLKEIISQKLYKSLGYNTSAVYCPQELGITARQARYLMAAAEVYHHLENRNHGSDSENPNHGSHLILPTSERQCRILAQLETAHQQAEVWSEAVEASEGNIPKLKTLEKIVKQKKKPMETPVKYQVTNQEVPKYPIEIKYKAGQPIEYSLKFKDPKSYALLVEYFELTGAATPDGLIQRVLTEAIAQLRKL